VATIAAIRNALAAVLVVPGFQTYSFMPASLNGKALVVRRLSTRYGTDFDGNDDSTFGVAVYVPWTDNATAQALLDSCLGSTNTAYSVKSLIEAAPTLNGVVDFVNVESVNEEGLVLVDNVTYLAATISVTVGSTDL
jgi:hypothetical protein